MSAFNRIAAALERIGLTLCADTCPVKDAGDLAVRVDVAARNFARGKRKADRERVDDDDGLDGLPPGAILEGRWD